MIECADGCVDEDEGWGNEDVIEAEAQEEELSIERRRGMVREKRLESVVEGCWRTGKLGNPGVAGGQLIAEAGRQAFPNRNATTHGRRAPANASQPGVASREIGGKES